MSEVLLGYVPCKNKKQAEKIANALLERRLIACANIVPAVNSCYRWEGEICSEEESLLLVKTIKSKRKLVEKVVKREHSYKIPCIGFLKFEDINKEYELWVKKETVRGLM